VPVQSIPPSSLDAMAVHLFISPHFDDVAFSCGAILAKCVASGDSAVLCTVFTRDRRPMNPFAEQCQVSKGIALDVEYLALREKEDDRAIKTLGSARIEAARLGFLEAPYRGYDSSLALFGEMRSIDEKLFLDVGSAIKRLALDCRAEHIYCCLGVGNHVDHRIVRAAVDHFVSSRQALYYVDTPYALKNPAQVNQYTDGMTPVRVEIGATLDAKLAACECYASQLGFQFGSASAMRAMLSNSARTSAIECGIDGFIERLYKQ
jgi:LmbE family N-acetylglucosaminyl deacetylase